jgi:molecular chaperone HtpG
MDFHWSEPKAGLQLYIQRVFIMDECADLLPMWLRFVKGVVDSNDLPLNVSREVLQQNRVVTQIRKGVVNKVLRTLEEMKEKEPNDFAKFYAQFGPVLKEGAAQDPEYRERLSELLLFDTTRSGDEPIDLATYVERMPEGQDAIWFLTGERRDVLKRSPYLEALLEKGQEVLLLTDPVDEFLANALREYKEQPLRAVDRGDLDESEEDSADTPEDLEGVFTFLKTALSGIKEVRVSHRLRDSAAVLVSGEGSVSAHLERLMKRLGRDGEVPPRELVLELNAEHPAVLAMQKLYEADPTDGRVEDIGRLLYDQAVLAEGSPVEDPTAMAARINKLIAENYGA